MRKLYFSVKDQILTEDINIKHGYADYEIMCWRWLQAIACPSNDIDVEAYPAA
jgi:hypothetical protein